MCERSGVVNIGIEGTMLICGVRRLGRRRLPGPGPRLGPSPFFGATPALLVALLCALLAGVLVSLVHAWLSISVRADQIISGTIINIAAFGMTGYLVALFAPSSPTGAGQFAAWTPPEELTDLPGVGWIFETFLAQGPITIVPARHRHRLPDRAVPVALGPAQRAPSASTRGRPRRSASTSSGCATGTSCSAASWPGSGGAYLSMEAHQLVPGGMTGGRGFIGLAAMIVGRWTPLGAFGAALLFASSRGHQPVDPRSPRRPASWATSLGAAAAGQFFDALPYLVTIIVLAGVVGRSIPPAADGQPYEREAAT